MVEVEAWLSSGVMGLMYRFARGANIILMQKSL
jgi:hypothetical protein